MLQTTWFRFAIAALAATASGSAFAAGELDCTFGAGGKATFDFGTGPAKSFNDGLLLPDGRVMMLGTDSGAIRLTRLTAGGDLDTTFGSNGTIVHTLPDLDFSAWLARDSQGRYIVGGRINPGGDSEALVMRFTPEGAFDTSFGGGDGWTSIDFTAATANAGIDRTFGVAVDASDRPVLAGTADANGLTINPSNADFAVARFTTAGVLDPTFSGDGIATASSPGTATDDTVRGVGIGTDGIITVYGDMWVGASNQQPRNSLIARFRPDGNLETAFDGDGVLSVDLSQTGGDDFALDLAYAADGDLFVLAQDSDDPLLGRINLNGTLDTSFGGDGAIQRSFFGGQDVVEHVVVQADGKVIVTGWPVVSSSFHYASMRFDAAGILDTTWGGTGVVSTSIGFSDRAFVALLQPNQRVILAGNVDGTRAVAVRYLADGDGLSLGTTTTITSDTPDPSALQQPVTVGVTVAASGITAPTGTFTVSDGAASCTGALGAPSGTSASGTCSLQPGVIGSRTLTASYAGSAGLCRSSGTTAHTVTRAATTLAITGDTPDPSIQGQPVIVSFSIASNVPGTITGSVTVSDTVNSCTADATVGSCALTLATSGSRPLTANYVGDTTYAPAVSTTTPHTVRVQVTPSAGAGGGISPSTPQVADRSATIPFTLIPGPGFHIDTVTGCNGSRDGIVYTTGPLIDNCTVAATFNADPVAVPGDQFVLEDSGPNGGTLFANDGDPLTFAIVTQPTKGAVTITNATTGAYTYTPGSNAVGADSFTFRASDAGGSSSPATITISITPVNDAPTFTLAPVPTVVGGTTTPQSQPGFASFDAGPPDEDATQVVQAWLVDAIADPAGVLAPGSVSIAANGTLAFTPTGLPGGATLTIRVRDDGGTTNGGVNTSAPGTATITVASSADLQVAKDDGRASVVSGDIVTYAIVATNAGPSPVTGAQLGDVLPASLANATWTCRAELSTVPCPTPASGTGNLALAIDLPVGGVLRFDLSATATGTIGAFVVNTATIATPAGTTSLDATNDSATDQDTIVPDGVFADGFEGSGSGVTVPEAQAVLRLH